jgi:hypothetical protein
VLGDSHKAANITSSPGKAAAAAKAAARIGQRGRCGACLTCKQQRQARTCSETWLMLVEPQPMLTHECTPFMCTTPSSMPAGQQPAVSAAAGGCCSGWRPRWCPGELLHFDDGSMLAATPGALARDIPSLSRGLDPCDCCRTSSMTSQCDMWLSSDCHHHGGGGRQAHRDLVGQRRGGASPPSSFAVVLLTQPFCTRRASAQHACMSSRLPRRTA